MKNIIIAFLLMIIDCTPINIIQNKHFNKDDREYIAAKLNQDMKCLSYYLKGNKEGKILIEFELNKNGKTKNVNVLNKKLTNTIFLKELKLFYKDTCHDFVSGIKIDKERKFIYEYMFTNSSNSPCFRPCDGDDLSNDVIEPLRK